MNISVALITLNEENNIEACLETVKWADEIIIVDSGSTDQTLAKARAYTSHIYFHPFENFALQKNEVLRYVSKDWVFFLDADERVTPELANEIKSVVTQNRPAVYGVQRLTFFFGKPLRYGGSQDDFPLRLFPKGAAHFEQPVHERLVTSLPILKLQHFLWHYSTKTLSHYMQKLQQYVALELETMHQRKRKPSLLRILANPVYKFIYRYFYKLGFLDGWLGFKFALLSAYYDFLKYRNYYQMKSQEKMKAKVP